MPTSLDLTTLQARRDDLLQRLASIVDLRPGSLAGAALPQVRQSELPLWSIYEVSDYLGCGSYGSRVVPGVEQFLLVDDVVAVENGAALVAGQEHGDPLGHAGADQVAGGRTSAIVRRE